MTLLAIEGFEGLGTTNGSGAGSTVRDYITSNYITDNTLRTTTNGSMRIENGFNSGKALSWGGDTTADLNYFLIPYPPVTEIIVGFAFKSSESYRATATILGIYNSTAGSGEFQVDLRVVDGRNLICFSDVFVRLNGTYVPDVITPNRWHYIEMRVKFSATVGEIEIHVDGVQVLNATNQDTVGDGGALNYDSIRFQGGEGDSNTDTDLQWLVDDIYICDTNGSVNNTFLGPIKVEELFPTAEGATINFTPSTGTDNSANVDDNPINDDTDYNSSSDTASNKDLFTTENLSLVTGNIKGVQITSQARSTSGLPVGMQSIVAEGTPTQGTGDVVEISSDSKYSRFSHIFETNPDTAAAWSAAEVDGMEIGYEID
jgi:hypothetical protein